MKNRCWGLKKKEFVYRPSRSNSNQWIVYDSMEYVHFDTYEQATDYYYSRKEEITNNEELAKEYQQCQ